MHPVLSSGCPLILRLLLECASLYNAFGYHLSFRSSLNLDAISSERPSIDLPQSQSASSFISPAAICSPFLVVFISIMPGSPHRGDSSVRAKAMSAWFNQCSAHSLHRKVFLNEWINDIGYFTWRLHPYLYNDGINLNFLKVSLEWNKRTYLKSPV